MKKVILKVFNDDNLSIMRQIESEMVDLIYIDPPFNTGKKQKRGSVGYDDRFEDFEEFIQPRLEECWRLLKPTGSFFVHMDYREIHYVKVLMDGLFGRNKFMNEIIWAYDYGGRSKKRWSPKHDNILWYVKDPKNYTFNYDVMDRIPYMAPGLVGEEKAKRGKTPTSCWWHTIVPTNGKEKTGYPTQKPRGVIDRIVKIHSNEGDLLLDCFAGSGTFGESALENNRHCILIDNNKEAIDIMRERFKDKEGE